MSLIRTVYFVWFCTKYDTWFSKYRIAFRVAFDKCHKKLAKSFGHFQLARSVQADRGRYFLRMYLETFTMVITHLFFCIYINSNLKKKKSSIYRSFEKNWHKDAKKLGQNVEPGSFVTKATGKHEKVHYIKYQKEFLSLYKKKKALVFTYLQRSLLKSCFLPVWRTFCHLHVHQIRNS